MLLDTSTYSSILKSDPTRTQGDKLIHILKGLGKPLRIRQGFIYWGVGEKLLYTPNTISSPPPQNIIINWLLYMFLFHFNICFLGSDFIRGAFWRPRFQNLFRRACMFPDTWSGPFHSWAYEYLSQCHKCDYSVNFPSPPSHPKQKFLDGTL